MANLRYLTRYILRCLQSSFLRLGMCYGCVVMGGCSSHNYKQPSSSQEIPYLFVESSRFNPPQPREWKLSNGLTVLVLPNRELPLVQGALYIRGGGYWRGEIAPGVVGAMGEMLREGGAGALTPDAFDYELERLAAAISSSFTGEYGTVKFSALSSDVERVLSLVADTITSPRFDEERLALWKGQTLEEIARRGEEPETVATLSFNELMYTNSVYGRIVVSEDIKRITRQDLLRAHERLVRPNEAYLAISGDISEEALRQLTERLFASWGARTASLPPPPPLSNDIVRPGIYFISQPLQQASVIMGHVGVPRLTPDYVAIEAFNELFSGGFASRLFAHIRTQLGLSYSIGGGISPGLVRGLNTIGLQTKAESTGKAIVAAFRELQELQESAPSGEELSNVQRTLENSFIFKFSSPEKIADRSAQIRMLQYPQDYDQRHLPQLRALVPGMLQEVAKNRWKLDDILIVVVGDERAYSALEVERRDPQSRLHKLPLIRASFDEKIRLPELSIAQ